MADNGPATGYGNGEFNPEDSFTKQDLSGYPDAVHELLSPTDNVSVHQLIVERILPLCDGCHPKFTFSRLIYPCNVFRKSNCNRDANSFCIFNYFVDFYIFYIALPLALSSEQ